MIRLLTGVLACLMISFSSFLSFSPTNVTDLQHEVGGDYQDKYNYIT